MEVQEVSEGWQFVSLDQIIEIQYGKGLPKRIRDESGSTAVYGSNGIVGQHTSGITEGPTIIVGRKGSVGEVHYSSIPCWPIDTTFFIDQFPEGLDPKYLAFFLKSQDLQSLSIHAAIPGIRRDDLYRIGVPLPYPDDPARSLETQRRIVARIEALFAELQVARDLHQEVVEDTGRLMEAVLAEVFGQLSGRESEPLGGRLSTRITKGESPGWQGFHYVEDGPLFIRSESVLWGELDLSKCKRIPDEFHKKLERSQLAEGDVLINLVGASIGRSAVVPPGIGAANINQAVAVISPDSEHVVSEFLMYYLISPIGQAIVHGGKVEAARANISLGDLKRLAVPLLPKNEQRQLASYLDSIRSEITEMKRTQIEDSDLLDNMQQAILAQAFRGEL